MISKTKTPAKVACLRRPVKVRRLRRLPVENDALRFCGFSSSLFPECVREGILLNFATGHDSSNPPPRSRFAKEFILLNTPANPGHGHT